MKLELAMCEVELNGLYLLKWKRILTKVPVETKEILTEILFHNVYRALRDFKIF